MSLLGRGGLMEELPAGLEDSSTLGNSDAHANTSQHSGCLPAHRDLHRVIMLPRCVTHVSRSSSQHINYPLHCGPKAPGFPRLSSVALKSAIRRSSSSSSRSDARASRPARTSIVVLLSACVEAISCRRMCLSKLRQMLNSDGPA